ncbi:hypothetical protein SUGI_0852100 [Cryptomeria japonica]|nr:hypothetical protein SUGI_0852100 [Cryptomeria japonica]
MATYSLYVADLAKKLAKLIVSSLGLDVKAFYHSQFEKYYSVVRLNGYSAKNMSIGEWALLSHTDLGCLTILYQDDVGGLQARSKEGEWFDVKPFPHQFVIKLGDSLKAWTNGRYHSPEHRVVYKGCKDRISIAFFTSFPEEKEIWAPEELVDENNPRRYKPFTYSHFWDSSAIKNKNDKDKATLLDRFAGM